MALFGEKYGDVVRVVTMPGLSMELCGGTHVRNTGQIGLFQIVARDRASRPGVRRIEAVTGPRAYALVRARGASLRAAASCCSAPPDGVEKRVEALLDERRALEKRLEEVLRGGGDQMQQLLAEAQRIGARARCRRA